MGSDRQIYKQPLQLSVSFLEADSVQFEESIVHCHTCNEVGNMRTDRVEK